MEKKKYYLLNSEVIFPAFLTVNALIYIGGEDMEVDMPICATCIINRISGFSMVTGLNLYRASSDWRQPVGDPIDHIDITAGENANIIGDGLKEMLEKFVQQYGHQSI